MDKLFRPYLSLPEISLLASLLSAKLDLPEAKTAYRKIFKLKLEAEMGMRQEAYKKAPSLMQKLGEEPPAPEIIRPTAELWEAWNTRPDSLSPKQQIAAKTYGWDKGLMSPVEQASFLREQGLE